MKTDTNPFLSELFRRRWTTVEKSGVLCGMLQARGFDVTDELRDRLFACDDLEQIESWLARAETITSLSELFD